jgi:hypothetical protein
MYCTGGVRCERASALLKSKFGDAVNGVYQLQVCGQRLYSVLGADTQYWIAPCWYTSWFMGTARSNGTLCLLSQHRLRCGVSMSVDVKVSHLCCCV